MILHLPAKGGSLSLAFGSIALGGVEDLLLPRDAELLQRPGDGHETAGGPQGLAQFLQRGVGTLPDEVAKVLELLRAEGGFLTTSMRPGLNRPGLPIPLDQ
jgi:hypothetical protein